MSSAKLQVHVLPITLIIVAGFIVSVGFYGRSTGLGLNQTLGTASTTRVINVRSEKNGLASISLNRGNSSPASATPSASPAILHSGLLTGISFNLANPPTQASVIN